MTSTDELPRIPLSQSSLSSEDLRQLRANSLLMPRGGKDSVRDREPVRVAPRLALYARRSRETDTSVSLGRQIATLESDVTRLAGIYNRDTDLFSDDDLSAKGGVFRPGMEQLLRDIQEGRYDGVVVWEYARWTRNRREGRIVTDVMRTAGCELYSHQEAWLSLFGPVGFLVEWATEQAARESEVISARITDWHTYTSKEGWHIGEAPFGTMKQERPSPWPDRIAPISVLVPDNVPRSELGGKSAAGLIQEAVEGVLRGQTISTLVKTWNQASYATNDGKPWAISTLTRILRNPALAGHAVKRGVIVERDGERFSPHTPAVDPIKWQRMNDELDLRGLKYSGRRSVNESQLRGLLRCGRCGSTLGASGGRSSSARSYQCPKRPRIVGQEPCLGNSTSAKRTEVAVWAMVVMALKDPKRLGCATASMVGPEKVLLDSAEDEMGRLREQLDKLDDERVDGVYADPDGARRFDRQQRRLSARLDEITKKLSGLNARRPDRARDMLDPSLPVEDAIAALSNVERKSLLHHMLEYLTVLPVTRRTGWDVTRLVPTWHT